MIAFTTRPTKASNITSRLRHWRSKCGRYRVTESVSLFGLPTVYYAALATFRGWRNLKAMERFPFYRTRKAALKACAQHERNRRYE